MNSDLVDAFRTVGTIVAAIGAAWLTGWLTRRSQKESTQLNLLTNLIDQVQEERDRAESKAAQIPKWRRYTQVLRGQIYKFGGTPEQADPDLEL